MPFLALLALGAAVAMVFHSRRSGAFDVHLPKVFEDAVLHAVKVEKNPDRLRVFGEALVEDYPVAAGVLMARARNMVSGVTSAGSFSRRHISRPHLRRSHDEADEAKRVTAALAMHPELAKLPPTDIARRLHARIGVVQAVLLSSNSAGHGLIVDPHILVSHVGEPTPPSSVPREHVVLAISAARGKPSAMTALNFLRAQDPKAARRAERVVAQALWAKRYS
jgi:hypothetical protein